MFKRFLHLSLGTHQQAQIEALSRLGTESLCINWKDFIHGGEDKLLDKIHKFNPTTTFMQIQDSVLSKAFIDMIPGKKFNWTGDVRDPIPHWYREISSSVVTLFSNITDVQTFKDENRDSEFLDIGYDPSIFTPHGVVGRQYDVVFFANHYGHRFPLSQFRRDVVNLLLTQKEFTFGLFGQGWLREFDIEIANYNKDPWSEAAIYRSAKIGLNIAHFDRPNNASDRIYRLIGSGCCCLSYKIQDQSMFPSLIEFDSIETLLPTIRTLLSSESLRSGNAALNTHHAIKNHTWQSRAEEFYRIAKKYGAE